MKTETQSRSAKTNASRADARHFANITHTAEGTRVITNNDDNTVTYGFQDLKVWSPRTQSWILLTAKDQDKFIVTCDDFTTASREFYDRWVKFTQRCFRTRISITSLND
jgi:LPXTG-site transpeptidase (sortase) family protein